VKTLILDSSVAAKWVLPAETEPFADRAAALLDRFAEDEVRFLVPDLFWAELGSILWKAVRQGRIPVDSAEPAIDEMMERKLITVPSGTLVKAAFRIASSFDRTVYDAIYVALAIEADAELVTADERLANALAARLPVKWLGAF